MFITFEGIEGVGKSTQLSLAVKALQQAGVTVVATREPGGTPMGEEIRDILLKHRHEVVDPLAELLLLFAARAQHLETIIRPSLKRGQWVVCDRFMDATYAYQGGGRGMSLDILQRLEKLILADFKPDLTFLLDAPSDISLQRITGRGGHPDRFEQEQQAFFERVRSMYQLRAEQDPKRFVVIDATLSLDQVQAIIETMLLSLLAKTK